MNLIIDYQVPDQKLEDLYLQENLDAGILEVLITVPEGKKYKVQIYAYWRLSDELKRFGPEENQWKSLIYSNTLVLYKLDKEFIEKTLNDMYEEGNFDNLVPENI